MRQLDLFYDKLPRYIITKQKGSNKLWVIWDDWKLKETNYVFISGQKAKQCLDQNLTQEYKYV